MDINEKQNILVKLKQDIIVFISLDNPEYMCLSFKSDFVNYTPCCPVMSTHRSTFHEIRILVNLCESKVTKFDNEGIYQYELLVIY